MLCASVVKTNSQNGSAHEACSPGRRGTTCGDPSHQLAGSREVTLAECARQTVIAHNDPSHMRDRVLRLFEQHHIPANILVSLPSLVAQTEGPSKIASLVSQRARWQRGCQCFCNRCRSRSRSACARVTLA